MKKYAGMTLSVFATLLLCGCGPTNIPLSQINRQNTHTVTIDPTVSAPASATYSGGNFTRAMAGQGLLGLCISSMIVAPSESKIKNEMTQCNIHVDQLFYLKFMAALKDQTQFKLVNNAMADGRFKLSIDSYGFSDKYDNKTTLPYMSVNGQLLDQQGKVIWKWSKMEYLTQQNYQSYSLQNYINDPNLMTKAFNTLATNAADDLVSTLNN